MQYFVNYWKQDPTAYDYDNVKRRVKNSLEAKRKLEREQEMTRFLEARAKRVADRLTAEPPPPKRVFLEMIREAVSSESSRLAAAVVVLLMLSVFIFASVMDMYSNVRDGRLSGLCRMHVMTYIPWAEKTMCYDSTLVVHRLNSDGTTSREGIDWSVNENQFKRAEIQRASSKPRRADF